MNRFASLIILAAACACQKQEVPPPPPPAGLAGTQIHAGSIALENESGIKAPPEDAAQKPELQGVVAQAVYKEGYSYLELQQKDGSKIWIALVQEEPKVGSEITVKEQAVLVDFHSKSLNRTFDKIVFATLLK